MPALVAIHGGDDHDKCAFFIHNPLEISPALRYVFPPNKSGPRGLLRTPSHAYGSPLATLARPSRRRPGLGGGAGSAPYQNAAGADALRCHGADRAAGRGDEARLREPG